MSTTYVSNFVVLLTLGLPVLGFEVVDKESLTATISAIVGVIALAYTFYGRWSAGGINAFGLRKSE